MDEMVQILKRLWSGEAVTFSGRHYHLEGVTLPLEPEQSGGPPIWIGGFSEQALRRTARFGDGWLPIEIGPEKYREDKDKIIQMMEQSGRTPRSIHGAFYLTINMKDDRADSHNEAEVFLNTYYNSKLPSIDRFGVFGNMDDCRRTIEGYRDAGAETIIVRFASFDPIHQMEAFADSMIPSFGAEST